MAEAVSYTIHGTKLVFPCKAYPTQLCMMDKIMKGLDRKQHCLLESPTGSGKSLALLCSCLAWQTAEYEKAKAQSLGEEETCKASPATGCCQSDNKSVSPMIIPEKTQVIDLTINSPVKTLHQNESSTPLIDSKVAKAELKPDGDEEDDFKCENKRFRTPGATSGVSKYFKSGIEDSISYNEGYNNATKNDPPEWKMELTNKESPCSSNETKSSGESDSKKNNINVDKIRVPKIYFGTRTHKQVAQITRELGKTAYKDTKMCILASREHTCIHPRVSTGRNKNEECRKLLDNTVKGETCSYYAKATMLGNQGNIKRLGLTSAWDIEDLTRVGKKQRACPYYAARELMKEADIVFCPYNYLIDPKIRQQMEIDLKDQIIVLDEAHNIEDSARESASLTITAMNLKETMDDIDKMISWRIMPNEYQSLHLMCANLMRWITKSSEGRMKGRGFEQAVSVMSGKDILEGLKEAGMTEGAYRIYQELFGNIMAADRDPDMDYEKTSPSPQSIMVLEGLFLVLGNIFGGKFLSDYRVTIQKTAVVVRGEQLPGGWKRAGYGTKKEWTYSLNFWCFNPAVVFSFIGSQARSIILTSGTLSPMTSFASELGVDFPIKLEANHVIANSQVWVATLGVGPSNSPINASYRFSETFSFQDDVGNLLLEVCEKVPHGVLCFFPSYNMLDKVSRRWQSTGLWSKLLQKKLVLSEPRGGDKTDFDDVMHEFYQAIRRSEGEEDEGVDSDDEDSCGSTGGALFLAVCRGKVSEGLDFADNNARAVITVGIPFPNTKDLKVDLKRKYNDEHASKRGLLNGSEWYEIQAFRALNQALGRCIRHKQDWGAILLVDERFTKMPRYSKSISKWVRQRIQHYKNFNQALDSLKDFTDARQLVPCPATQTPKTPKTPRTSLSSTADGSFLSDTSLNREEPSTPCASTPLAPRNDLIATDSPGSTIHSALSNQSNLQSSNAPSQLINQSVNNVVESSGDHSKQFICTPISQSKPLDQTKLRTPVDQILVHTQQDGQKQSLPLINNAIPVRYPNVVGQANSRSLNEPPRPTVGVNPTGTITAVNQVLSVNSQQGILQQNVPVMNNINPQAVTPRFIFIPNNALGTPNANTTIRVNSATVPRPTAPGSRVQQVLFLTPVQLNNQNIGGQTPRFVYTTPKTLVFTPNKNGPLTPSTQNLPAVVSQGKESLTQGNVVNSAVKLSFKDTTKPTHSVNSEQSTQVLVKENVKPSEKCEGVKNISEQTDTTDVKCVVNTVNSGQCKDNMEDRSDETVVRNQSTLESICVEEEVECPKLPLNVRDVNQFPKSEKLPNRQPEPKNIAKNIGSVIKEQKTDVEMCDLEFPESPDMFATPSPETEQLIESHNNEDKEHGLKTAIADATNTTVSEGPSYKVQPVQNGESHPQMNASEYSSVESVDLGLAKADIKGFQSGAPCGIEIEDAKKDAEIAEGNFEKENPVTPKKMRVDSNPSSMSLRNTRRNSAMGETNLKGQVKEGTLKSEIPDEIKPVRRNLRRATQRQGAKTTTRSTENRRDVKEDSISTTSLCCKRCNAQLCQGVATQQTIQSQHLANLYSKLVSLNPKTRLTKKRKREGSMDRIVWTVEKNDVGENVGVMADSDKVPSQQDYLLNALYVPSENHLYVPLECIGCNTKNTPCFVIGVEIMSLSTHSTTTVSNSKQVYFFSEAVCITS